ncbi:hypothetical protein NEDG_00682 [Nematocida displodere]|uniref:Uncharacterized protein n=1 Tax=Nematocida displodere TaxID=1805483 RepID=A0A177EEY1_9MICR|nr:hypothetical protein NEDG_00682 [Nematocida displodere]
MEKEQLNYSDILTDTFSLSLEDARNENSFFLDRAKEAYEHMKKLKRDAETHKKKKKALEQQIEKMRGAFTEYIQSIELLESSPLYQRISPPNKLTHSRLLKYCHVYMPPLIAPETHINEQLITTINKACAEYKQAKVLGEEIVALSKMQAQPQLHASEIEARYEVFERTVNYTNSKMNFSLLVNHLSLQLMGNIFAEIEDTHRTSMQHTEACLGVVALKKHQSATSDNTTGRFITQELSVITATAYEEIERHKRRILNEKRPQSEGATVIPKTSNLKRKYSKVEGFIVAEISQKPECALFTRLEIDGKSLRGTIHVFKKRLIITETAFGWKFLIQKQQIYYTEKTSSSLTILTKDLNLTVFTCFSNVEMLHTWITGIDTLRPRETLIGRLNAPADKAFTLLFAQDSPIKNEPITKAGYTVLEDTVHDGDVRRRKLEKTFKYLFFQTTVTYTEVVLTEKRTKTDSRLLFLTDISVGRFLPTFSGISKLRLVSSESTETTPSTTKVLYSFRQSTNSSIARYLTHLVTKYAAVEIHSLGILGAEGEILPQVYLVPSFLVASVVIALLSFLLTTKILYNALYILCTE